MAIAIPVAVDSGISDSGSFGRVLGCTAFFVFKAAVGLPEVVFEGLGVREIFTAEISLSR